MQYTEVHIDYTKAADYVQDIVEQALADIGYESFLDGVAYVQTALYSESALQQVLTEWPMLHLIEVRAAEDRNWNETWEQSYDSALLSSYGLSIIPRNAFGSGTHPTTCMMLDALRDLYKEDEAPRRVLDMGCGTGVLGIYCALHGAEVTAVDIDEWSVRNTEENAALNGVTLDTQLRDIQSATGNLQLGVFDLILANIHRNIILNDLPLYLAHLAPMGMMLFSGFYEDDLPVLRKALETAGLHITNQYARDEWRMIIVSR